MPSWSPKPLYNKLAVRSVELNTMRGYEIEFTHQYKLPHLTHLNVALEQMVKQEIDQLCSKRVGNEGQQHAHGWLPVQIFSF
jgi:hypothetical protein